jgi:hypothetical protein
MLIPGQSLNIKGLSYTYVDHTKSKNYESSPNYPSPYINAFDNL